MTYRERRTRRAERLHEWADTREARATAQLASQPDLRHDPAFITQPGHIPERDRMNRRDDAAFRSLEKAAGLRARAEEIERQAARAIYDDDPDAIDRLRERIADLEERRVAMTAANAEYRRAHRAELATMTAYERSQAVPHPSYALQNLGGNIRRLRQRLARITSAKRHEYGDRARAECSRCGVVAECRWSDDPFLDDVHDSPGEGVGWWCDDCYQSAVDDI